MWIEYFLIYQRHSCWVRKELTEPVREDKRNPSCFQPQDWASPLRELVSQCGPAGAGIWHTSHEPLDSPSLLVTPASRLTSHMLFLLMSSSQSMPCLFLLGFTFLLQGYITKEKDFFHKLQARAINSLWVTLLDLQDEIGIWREQIVQLERNCIRQ